MRADVKVIRGRTRIEACLFVLERHFAHGFSHDARKRPAPPGMEYRKTSRRRHDNRGKTIGEAEKRCFFGNVDDNTIGSFCCLLRKRIPRFCVVAIHRNQIRAVNLIRHQHGRLGKPQRIKKKLPILSHGKRIIGYMRCQIQRIIRRLAHATEAQRKPGINANRRRKSVVCQKRYGINRMLLQMRIRQPIQARHGASLSAGDAENRGCNPHRRSG